jgi:hypothetical protein
VSDTTTTMMIWHITGSEFIDADPEVDVVALSVSDGTRDYAVSVCGRKGMKSNEFINALRAAVAGLLIATGADPKAVGCESLEDPIFNTGNQRAN